MSGIGFLLLLVALVAHNIFFTRSKNGTYASVAAATLLLLLLQLFGHRVVHVDDLSATVNYNLPMAFLIFLSATNNTKPLLASGEMLLAYTVMWLLVYITKDNIPYAYLTILVVAMVHYLISWKLFHLKKSQVHYPDKISK